MQRVAQLALPRRPDNQLGQALCAALEISLEVELSVNQNLLARAILVKSFRPMPEVQGETIHTANLATEVRLSMLLPFVHRAGIAKVEPPALRAVDFANHRKGHVGISGADIAP